MRRRDGAFDVPDNPLWYKDAVIYQTHVRAFHDSNANGIGDYRGLTAKLDYLEDLGVTAIWLLPFYPSPLKEDGYDIADYTELTLKVSRPDPSANAAVKLLRCGMSAACRGRFTMRLLPRPSITRIARLL